MDREIKKLRRAVKTDPSDQLSLKRLEHLEMVAGYQWFSYKQNNSGGSFVGPEWVSIQARSQEEAEAVAVTLGGIYFDGIQKGIDCHCCGDRWSRWPEVGLFPMDYGGDRLRPGEVRLVYADGRVDN